MTTDSVLGSSATKPTTADRSAPAAQLHAWWAAVAPAWGQHAPVIDARAQPLTRRMLELAALAPGDHVLELACGPGGLGLEAAQAVAPSGSIVLSDVAAEMVEVAASRAASMGLSNIRTAVLDLEHLDVPDGSFDVVLCRDGLQFAFDPAVAAGEIHRVLRPGGRAVLAVWGRRQDNPWLGLVLDAVSAELGVPIPPPGGPGPFALDDRPGLARLLAAAGLDDVATEELALPMQPPSFEAWWAMTTTLAGPVAVVLAQLPEPTATAIRERARTAAGAYAVDGGLRLPGLAVVASAHRP